MQQVTLGQTSISEARLVLYFNEDAMDANRAVWFVRHAEEVDVLPGNGVCLKQGELSDLAMCADFLGSFPAVLVAIADAGMRAALVDAFAEYLPQVKIALPRDGAFLGKASLAELVSSATNKEAALNLFSAGVKYHTAPGLLLLSEVERESEADERAYLSGIPAIDAALGGFRPGEISILTGRRGEGKSTLLSQFALEALEQGHRVCAYSGELTSQNYQRWALLQAAGPRFVYPRQGPGGSTYYEVEETAGRLIREWWGSSFVLLDNRVTGASDSRTILERFNTAALRYGCDVFVLDNLLTTGLSADRDFYREQSAFVGELKAFAVEHNVHVHVVAHPRKTGGERLDADDVSGSGGITDRADVVLALERLTDKKSNDAKDHGMTLAEKYQCDASLKILKDRHNGATTTAKLLYDETCRRFYPPAGVSDRVFGWRRNAAPHEVERDGTEPF